MTQPTPLMRVNGESVPYRAGSVMDLLQSSEIDPRARGIAVAVNGAIVPRGAWSTQFLNEGDEVEIVGAVQGG